MTDPTEQAQSTAQSEELPVMIVVAEVAKILRYNQETVRRRLRAGTLPGKRVGGKWLSPRAEIDRIAGLESAPAV